MNVCRTPPLSLPRRAILQQLLAAPPPLKSPGNLSTSYSLPRSLRVQATSLLFLLLLVSVPSIHRAVAGVNSFTLVVKACHRATKSPPNAFHCTGKIPTPHCALKAHGIWSRPPFGLTSYHSCSREADLLSVLLTHFVFVSLFLLFQYLKNSFEGWWQGWFVSISGLTSNVISSLATRSKPASHSLSIISYCFIFFIELTFIPIFFVCLHLFPCLLSVSGVGNRINCRSI